MARYANIIIDISHEKLDKTFQYRIPEQLQAVLEEGMRVRVPFGNGGRMLSGYVVELTDTAEYDPAKLKMIQSIDKNSLAIESKLIALAAWMRKNYGATMNQALKTVLPVKQKTAEKMHRRICLAMEQNQAQNLLCEYQRKHYTAKARLLEALMENPVIDYEVVTKKLHITPTVIRGLQEQSVLEIETQRSYRNPIKRVQKKEADVRLNEMQQNVVEAIIENARTTKKPCLIHGVTGSGKTEVYMELIAEGIRRGRPSIVLIPEIALTYQTVMRFYGRFGDRVSIMNSRLSPGERFDQFERAKRGEIDVMIGPRSALFTPFPKLGYIIIDEEHESSYKSETMPRYHARETAIEWARMHGATVVLGSATPSVDSYYKAQQGEYLLLQMPRRVMQKSLPECHIVDLRQELAAGNYSILSRRLQELMTERLEKQEQIMLFLNRRGVAGFVSCRSCGYVIKCPHCDVSMSAHNNGRLMCHYCGYEQEYVSLCPNCGSKYIGGFRAGTQKIEQMVRQSFPRARVLRMDADTTKNKDSYEEILSAFANEQADILIGTQMIVKGHDFPKVTLVGVLAADLSLGVPDYRAAERTFQLLTQAAGRAGRGERPGEVIIQTYQPEHYSVTTAGAQDYEGFYEKESGFRGLMHYPPVWNMLQILSTSKKEEEAVYGAAAMAECIREKHGEVMLVGPTEAAVPRISDMYRQVLYVRHPDYAALVSVKDELEQMIEKDVRFKNISVQFDFNPMNGF
ncbi:MAG: primosomal protein N' [Lachnospiraceae bacterium]|nr:primosomal protein N' [Lachnospiraceae bacterium]